MYKILITHKKMEKYKPVRHEMLIDKLRNHVSIDELTKHDFIPLEAGLRNIVKNGRIHTKLREEIELLFYSIYQEVLRCFG